MSPLSYRLIQSAAISTQKKQLHNQQFDDIYHHSEAVAESQFVFHEGNRLLSQWHDKANEPLFVIAETGFGSGLNFLTTRRLWQNCDNKPQHLHYISTEQWLLTPAQLLKAYQDFPDLQPDLVKIQQVFQLRRAGFHSYQIDKDITLHLLLGDACHCLQQLNAQVDAWFLDGFSPAKNPAMWSPDLFQQIARLSRPGGSFATFTAASQVRKNLQAAGFEVVKTTGFKGKRERLVGQFKTLINPEKDKQAWAPTPQATHPVDRITIIGGGVAGLCLAKMARQKGLNVTVIDRQAQPLAGASGNPFALMMPYLTAQYSPEALFYWRAFEAALRFYPKDIFKAIGVNEVKQQPRPDDARLGFADDLIQATKSGFYYPNSGRINTTALAPYLMAAVDTWLTAEVAYFAQNTQGQWLVQDSNRNTI
ncbi:MAG: FAD-dependent oxidoreductase, partial [Proteobacteria bacterium]